MDHGGGGGGGGGGRRKREGQVVVVGMMVGQHTWGQGIALVQHHVGVIGFLLWQGRQN